MNQPIRGTTRQCLMHYLSTLPTTHLEVVEARRPIADFVGVRTETIGHWRHSRGRQVGLYLIKVQYFLESRGYVVTELERLEPEARDLGRLITHGVVSVEEAVQKLGIPGGRGGPSYLFRILRGDIGISATKGTKKAKTVREMVRRYSEALERIKQAKVATTPIPELTDHEPKRNRAMALAPQPQTDSVDHPLIIEALANLIKAVLPLAKRVASDFTPEQRRELRRLAGDSGVFQLSTALNRLCSETARRIVDEGGTGQSARSQKPRERTKS